MLSKADRRRIAVNIWTARVIPLVLGGTIGYATYVLVALLCVHYLLVEHDASQGAIPILVIYFTLLFLMTICFLRLLYITTTSPPYLPLGRATIGVQCFKKNAKERVSDWVAGREYDGANTSKDVEKSQDWKNDPDSPGLELFYTKDVFVCEADGRPKWCSECENWKRDRTHHCSSSGRCILKMDHFCPWVGGPIGENNFKFFLQFTMWAAVYCAHLVVVMAYYVHRQIITEGESVNSQFAAVLGLAAFFCLFTTSMTGTSIDLVLRNLTQVEKIGLKTRVPILAVHIPNSRGVLHGSGPYEHHLPYSEITYPLDIDQNLRHPQHERSRPIQNPQIGEGTPISIFKAPRALQDAEQANTTDTTAGSSSNLEMENTKQNATGPLQERSENPRSALGLLLDKTSSRDVKATRTFAVLRMPEPGINPWDLGNPLLNWQTVMGENVIDWLLPVRRSPCCSHENPESQFAVGPAVDNLCTSYGLKGRNNRRPRRRHETTSFEMRGKTQG